MNAPPPSSGPMISLDAAQVFERYTALRKLADVERKGELGGCLVLYGQVDERGSAIALAASIAGAASMGISPDPEILKMAIRNGVCDFMVNTLDEALRILKNEIRKKQPVSVGLQQEFAASMEEILARGIQPDVLALSAEESDACSKGCGILIERGSSRLPDIRQDDSTSAMEVWWSVEGHPALWLPKLDVIAAEVLGDEVRGRWLRLAPRYLGRRAHSLRYVAMTASEGEAFLRATEHAILEKSIETSVTVKLQGREVRLVSGK